MRQRVELAAVVGAVATPVQWDDAIRMVAAAERAGHQVRRVDRPLAAYEARASGDLHRDGTLTYRVRTGVVNVYRGAADQNPRVVRRVGAGRTGVVHAGEWVIERPRVVHFGANRGNRPVLIMRVTLCRNGSPSSIPIPG